MVSVCSGVAGLSNSGNNSSNNPDNNPGKDSGSDSGNSVLAVHTGALGDIILFGHLLHLLKSLRQEHCEGCRTTLIACGERDRLLSRMGIVDCSIEFDNLAMHEVFSENDLNTCTLTDSIGHHERLVSCFATGNMRAELRLAALCGVADAAFLPIRPAAEHHGHILDLWLDMLGLDASAGDAAEPWCLHESDKGCAEKILRAAGIGASQRYVVLHPGSGGSEKCWSPERFKRLADGIGDEEGLTPVFVVGPVESDRWGYERIRELTGAHALVLCPSLVELTDILCGAEAYVGNDSGVSHLAGAVGIQTVVLFGASRSEHYAPVGRSVTVIEAATLAAIGVGQVLAAINYSGE